MSEEGTAGTSQKPEGEKPEGGAPEKGRTYTQEDLDNITSKVKSNAERRAAELEKQLESLRKQSETEQEKAIREAREAAASEVAATKDAELRRVRLEAALIREGLADEQAERLAKLAGDGDLADEVKSLKEEFAPMFGQSKSIKGGTGVQRSVGDGMDLTDPETINRIIRDGKYEEYRERIEAARRAKLVGQGHMVTRVK